MILPIWLILISWITKSLTDLFGILAFGIVKQSSFDINKTCLLLLVFDLNFTISNDCGLIFSKYPSVVYVSINCVGLTNKHDWISVYFNEAGR